jgi:hypothetical protein
MADKRPTDRQIEAALDVLLWLHEHTDDGRDRDEISHVRHLLDEVVG